MRPLFEREYSLVAGGVGYDEAALTRIYGTLFNAPARLAFQTPGGFGIVVGVADVAFKIGTAIYAWPGVAEWLGPKIDAAVAGSAAAMSELENLLSNFNGTPIELKSQGGMAK